MKKVILTIIAALFILVGCQENNSILEPETEQFDASTLKKGRIIIDRNLDDGGEDEDLKDFFFLDDSTSYGGNEAINDFSDEIK